MKVWGPKSLACRENQLFGWIFRDLGLGHPGGARKIERKKKICTHFASCADLIACPVGACSSTFGPCIRKILAPIKIKSALPPPPQKPKSPPPLPKTRNFMDMVFPAERTHFFQVSIKLAQPYPAPELRTRILRTRGFFWVQTQSWKERTGPAWDQHGPGWPPPRYLDGSETL